LIYGFGIQVPADYFLSLSNNLEKELSLHRVNISSEICATSGKTRRNNLAIEDIISVFRQNQ